MKRQFLVVGLPAHGKTTFIAALWHVLEHGGENQALRLVELTGDRTYLNKILERWLQCEPALHTSATTEELVTFHLASEAGRAVELSIPDMSGESFQGHWAERIWSAAYDQLVANASGLLLLIHPHEVAEPVAIETAESYALSMGETPATQSSVEVEPFDLRKVATQVQLVDLLQMIASRRPPLDSMRVALIVSAWDLVEDQGTTPSGWIQKRLPLLDQFLKSNSSIFPVRVYGVSAQGGRYPEDAERLREMAPHERIRIVADGVPTREITVPIRWLMSSSP